MAVFNERRYEVRFIGQSRCGPEKTVVKLAPWNELYC